MSKKRKRVCSWFVEPLDITTNNAIGETLQDSVSLNACWQVTCQDGVEHNLWRCPNFAFIARLMRDRKRLYFKVYNQWGDGPIREVSKLAEKMCQPKKTAPTPVPNDNF